MRGSSFPPAAPTTAAETIGRIAVVFLFNELAVNGIALATRRTPLRPLGSHLLLLAVAAVVVACPWIAAAGSSPTIAAWPAVPRWLGILATTMFSQAGLWAEIYLVTGLLLDAVHNRPPATRSIWGNARRGAGKAMVYGGVFMAVVYGVATLCDQAAVREAVAAHPLLWARSSARWCFP